MWVEAWRPHCCEVGAASITRLSSTCHNGYRMENGQKPHLLHEIALHPFVLVQPSCRWGGRLTVCRWSSLVGCPCFRASLSPWSLISSLLCCLTCYCSPTSHLPLKLWLQNVRAVLVSTQTCVLGRDGPSVGPCDRS